MISLISLTVLVLHAKESDEPLRFLALSLRFCEKIADSILTTGQM